MAAESVSIVTTGGVALLFAAVFAWGGRVHLLGALGLEPRSVMSFSGGMTAAYVFVHLMPELHGARAVLVDSASASLRYEGVGIYYLALICFL
jgi:hypothetical protein